MCYGCNNRNNSVCLETVIICYNLWFSYFCLNIIEIRKPCNEYSICEFCSRKIKLVVKKSVARGTSLVVLYCHKLKKISYFTLKNKSI